MKLSKVLAVVLLIAISLSVLCTSVAATTVDFMPVVDNGCFVGTDLKTPQSVFRELFGSRDLTIYANKKEVPADSDVNMGTGFKIEIDDRVFYNVVVMGDIDGDGELTSMDYIMVSPIYISSV